MCKRIGDGRGRERGTCRVHGELLWKDRDEGGRG